MSKMDSFPKPFFLGTDTTVLTPQAAAQPNFASHLSAVLSPISGALSNYFSGKVQGDVAAAQAKQAKQQAEIARITSAQNTASGTRQTQMLLIGGGVILLVFALMMLRRR